MAKLLLTFGSTYVGTQDTEIELDYSGTEEDFENDHELSTEILNMLTCGEVNHYFLHYEFIEDEDEEEDRI